MRASPSLLALVFASVLPGSVQALPLSALLDNLPDNSRHGALEAEIAVTEAERQWLESEAGWTLFGTVTAGSYDELVINGSLDEYSGQAAALGLRYPLLGTLRERTRAADAVALSLEQTQLRRRLLTAEQRLAIRTTYAEWWQAQQGQRICDESAGALYATQSAIEKRLDAGEIRLSEAMDLSQQARDILESCENNTEHARRLRSRLAYLSRQDISATARAEATILAREPQSLDSWADSLQQHPALLQQRKALDFARRDDYRWYDSIRSSFSVGHQIQLRSDADDTGTGWVASLNFEVPLDAEAGTSLQNAARARQRLAEENLQVREEELMFQLSEALASYPASIQQMQYLQERLEYAKRYAEEVQARTSVDEDFVKTVVSQLNVIRQRRDLADARLRAWQQESELRLFAELLGAERRLMGEETVATTADPDESLGSDLHWRQATYMWDSRALLDPQTRDAVFKQLQQTGLQEVYLGLTAQQVAALPSLKPEIAALLSAAGERGIRIQLLLGEPAWITDAGRSSLMDLITRLSDLSFAGLHLDLEVEQLGWPVPNQRLRDWVRTLEAAKAVSPWPLAISTHYRWLLDENNRDYCVACEFARLNPSSVSLMAYMANADRSSELVSDIARNWPALTFRLAQSVEPGLAASESWAGTSLARRQALVAQWRSRLQPFGVSGIDWQDWSAYRLSSSQESP